jgi:hypothetical protein
MAIKNTSVTLDGLKYNLDDRDRVAAQLVNENANTFTAAQTNTVGVQCAAVARTATSDGLTTGTIADGTSHVTVTCGNAAHIIVLPTPTPGNVVTLSEDGTTGYELRSSAPATVAINGGTDTNGESAIAGAITYVTCVCVSATSWICSQYDADGDESKVTAAAD